MSIIAIAILGGTLLLAMGAILIGSYGEDNRASIQESMGSGGDEVISIETPQSP